MDIRVLLCHGQPLVRAGLRTVLDREPDVDVVGDFADGYAAADRMAVTAPTVVVADVTGFGEGVGLLADAVRDCGAAVLVVGERADMDCAEFSLRAGATGFLLYSDPLEQIAYGVRAVAAGHAVLSPEVTSLFLADFTRGRRRKEPDLRAILTPRELEVLQLLASGMSVPHIAERLFVAEVTVRSHVHHFLQKLGLDRSFQAVALAYYTGLIDPISSSSEPAHTQSGVSIYVGRR